MSETDYAPRTGLFLGSEGRWEMGRHRRGGWVKQIICVWFHPPMLSWTSFQKNRISSFREDV